MKATFSRGDKPEKNAVEGKVPRTNEDVGSCKHANIESDEMYSIKYGYCDILKKGMAFKCHSPFSAHCATGSWELDSEF